MSFLGRISEDDKLALLRRSWALAFASPKEGWGITNLEAQACGTPVVASDSPGLRESVLRDETGLLLPHGSEDLLAGAMDLLARSPAMVEKMGRRGREFATTFSWDQTANRTEMHIQLAIDQAGK